MKLLVMILAALAQSTGTGVVVSLPTDLEVQLARSALPAHLAADATVYVYRPERGYVVEVEGSNGFHALVGRDDPAIRWASFEAGDYPTDFLIPVAFDEAGAAAQLQVYLDLGRWRAEGVPAAEAQRRLREGFTSGRYAAPERGGVGYMLSPILRSYRATEVDATVLTFSLPHYMFYAPGVDNEEVGGGRDLRHPRMRPTWADPHGMIIVVAGETEREAYRVQSAALLARLCEIHSPWCLDQPSGGR